MGLTTIDVIGKLDEARETTRLDLYKDRFAITARFSGSRPCLCGKRIQVGEQITRPPDCPVWIHLSCADLDASESKVKSKAFALIEKLGIQAQQKQAAWKDDLVELARLVFLGQWGSDYWLEDRVLAIHILDTFGIHKLTAGWRGQSDKSKQKYAQKIEKAFAWHKGWICRKCHRLIWVKKSVTRGIGPVCFKHSLERFSEANDPLGEK